MKWSLLKKRVSGTRRAAGRSKGRLLILAAVSLFALASVTLMAPKPSYADTGNNDLWLVGENCHDLNDITHDFGIGSDGRCHDGDGGDGWQEVLNKNLDCSSGLFYQHPFTDPRDPTYVTKTRWYTKLADYKDCWEKAQNTYNAMSDPKGDCAVTRDGSDNNKKCFGYRDKLHAALGCDTDMFQKANSDGTPNSSGDYWALRTSPSNDCKSRIDKVGNMTYGSSRPTAP